MPTPVLPVLRDLIGNADLRALWTHRELAARVYATNDPTAAQLSAVRRAVAVLVAEGVAERTDRDWRAGRGTHMRRVLRIVDIEDDRYLSEIGEGAILRTRRWLLEPVDIRCDNPGGVLIGRAVERALPDEVVARDRELEGQR